jgi:signal transduction histidine kinase
LRSFEALLASRWKAVLLVPLELGSHGRGLLALKSLRRRGFTSTQIRLVEATARIAGLVSAGRFVDSARSERTKELTCLHAIAQIRTRRDLTTHEQLERIVRTLPPAWRYPELAAARIEIDGREFSTRALEEGSPRLSADIKVRGEKRGVVEVSYQAHLPTADARFLKEEASLLDTVAKELTLMLERKMAEEEEAKALAQLRHADRLATIGQLSAGVAHEINEPLSSILGFTQLILKEPGLPEQALQDLQMIEKAALQAREVMRNLLLFARQMPTPPPGCIELNQVVRDALNLLQPRLGGHELEVELEPFLPPILGNTTHLHQVVVNLVTNAAQAMPEGGRLTVRTLSEGEHVRLVVEDTGIGMTAELSEQAFLPFFTTKDVGEGTGLGLSVAHGIVASHGGSIDVQSEPGVGSRFTVSLPVPARQSD